LRLCNPNIIATPKTRTPTPTAPTATPIPIEAPVPKLGDMATRQPAKRCKGLVVLVVLLHAVVADMLVVVIAISSTFPKAGGTSGGESCRIRLNHVECDIDSHCNY